MTNSRLHLARASIGAAAIALLAAACGGSSDGGSSSGDNASSGALVSTSSVDGTATLTDAAGKTLYSTDVEANGQIKCVEACTSFWVPLMATSQQAKQASTQVGKTFATVDRPDGGTQLTYQGLPLYTFAGEGADELKGNGFTDDFQGTHFVWEAAGTEGSAPASSGDGDSSGGGRYGY